MDSDEADVTNVKTKPLTLVQQRALQFEQLAASQNQSLECNWWLSDNKSHQSANLKPIISVQNSIDGSICDKNYSSADESAPINENKSTVEDFPDEEETDDDTTAAAVDDHENIENEDVIAADEEENNIEEVAESEEVLVENPNENDGYCSETSEHNEDLIETKNVELNDFRRDDLYDETDDSFTDSFDDSFSDDDDEEDCDEDIFSNKPAIHSKLNHIVEELLANEKVYIDKLAKGIENYVHILDERDLIYSLRGQKYRIFGNIENILDFHQNTFYPELLTCNGDIEEIANVFSKYIQKGLFYNYVLYAMNKKRSEIVRNIQSNCLHFLQRQNEIGDRLGVNSLLVEPIQRLPKYALLLDQLIKELSPSLMTATSQIAACSKAERNVRRILETVNEAMVLNDIIEGYGINIFQQGKFQKLNEFMLTDMESRRKYRSNVFLFEKCIIFTEIIDTHKLKYRGYFPKETTGIAIKQGKNKFVLFIGKRGRQEVSFTADFNTIQVWTKFISDMVMETAVMEKQKITQKHHQIQNKNQLRPADVIVRASVGSSARSSRSHSDASLWSTGTLSSGYRSEINPLIQSITSHSSSSSSNSRDSTSSADSSNQMTKWYIPKLDN